MPLHQVPRGPLCPHTLPMECGTQPLLEWACRRLLVQWPKMVCNRSPCRWVNTHPDNPCISLLNPRVRDKMELKTDKRQSRHRERAKTASLGRLDQGDYLPRQSPKPFLVVISQTAGLALPAGSYTPAPIRRARHHRLLINKTPNLLDHSSQDNYHLQYDTAQLDLMTLHPLLQMRAKILRRVIKARTLVQPLGQIQTRLAMV
jgi:hypothetical protein